ncbi:sulfur carrier protein ThiS [Ottowia caeni]|uniref:sulfur carrier protein ThiS n=1 Tax=Ottowia caeni TaxID=2870339 RepID=UPI003D71D887
MKDNRISNADTQALQAPAVMIKLDGQAREVLAGTTLAQLVAALGHEEKSVSTAVNGEFVARSARSRELLEGDTVLLFQPIVGG